MPPGPVRRSRWAFWRVPVQQVVDDELAFHIEMQTRRYVEGGMSPEAARARALQRFGDVNRVRDECRTLGEAHRADVRRAERLGTVWQDARHALRLLRRAPGFAAVAVLTLALGVGASTALFSVVNAALLRALPYAHAERVVMLWNASADGPEFAVSPAEFADQTEQARAFDAMAALSDRWVNLTGGGAEPERVVSYRVSPNIFDVLGIRPRLGRSFGGADGQEGGAPVVIISDALWRRRFGADPGAVGRPLAVNGTVHTVVGVMPPEVRFPDEPLGFLKTRAELWVPRDWRRDRGEDRGNQYLGVIARLRPGATLATARADVAAIGARWKGEWPDRYAGDRRWRIAVVPLREQMVGSARRGLLVLLGAVGLVLLIGCANVANLLLARGAARRRELGVRAALGAGRGRIARQLLTESVVLAGGGGALGVGLAWLGVRALAAIGPAGVPRLDAARLDGAVLTFALGVSLVTALAFGLLPAAQQAAVDAAATLRGGGGRGTGAGSARRGVRAVLVAGEVGLALVVLVGAGLLLRSFDALRSADAGFSPTGAAAMQLALPRTVYDSGYKLTAFHTELQRQLGALPGVTRASAVYPLPMSGEGWGGSFFVEGQPVAPGKQEPHAELAVALPGYFAAMGIPLKAGRDFTDADRRGAPRVVVIDEELARRYWPGESAVGKRVNFDPEAGYAWMTVVGVVRHVRNHGPREAGEGQLYMAYLQQPQGPMFVVARSDRDPATLAPALRRVVRGIDAQLPVGRLEPMPEVVARAVSGERFQLLVLGGFAALALVLAAVGLYGVTAYLVSQRTPELGLRLALGGRPRDVTRLVVGEGLAVAGAGLAAGVVAALGLARVMAGLLYGVRPTDPPTYAGIAALLLAVCLLACWVPARRAARTDPARTLRA